jgi:hypothetical protein
MIVDVEYCTPDCATAEEAAGEPCAFFLGGRRIGVKRIVDRWPSELCSYIKLQADDGSTYILRHQASPEQWDLVLYQSPDSPAGKI